MSDGIRRTRSVCPRCLKNLPASLRKQADGRVLLEKTCPEHGSFRVTVWQGTLDFDQWLSGTEPLAEGAGQWSSLVIRCFTNAVLIGIGSVLIDLDAMSAAISPSWLMLVIIITVAVTLGAAAGGYAVGFYPIESAITAGLCTINMGGSGNIAILSASKRMELLAFAQLATRICGSLVLVLSSILIRVFL